MITDEERREIAKELRLRSRCEEFESCDKCEALSVRLFGDKWVLCQLDDCDANYWGALADLIDRGECENVYDWSVQDSCDNGFLCSVCGCKVEDEEHYRVSGVWNYCPGCGRVVRHG